MKENRSSGTADIVTIIRAYWYFNSTDPVFLDPFAFHLLPDWLKKCMKNPIFKGVLWVCTIFSKPAHAEVLGRARYVEDVFSGLHDKGVRQYVLVGAGMDSFAWRQGNTASSIRVFELDHPATHHEKQHRLLQQQLVAPDNLEYVSIDFEKESIADALGRSGFDAELPAVFCWMGVTYYLSESVVYQALQSMQEVAADNSRIVFDYRVDASQLPMTSRIIFRFMKWVVGMIGEPMASAFEPIAFENKLNELALEVEENLSSEQLKNKYFTNNADGLYPMKGMHIMHVKVAKSD